MEKANEKNLIYFDNFYFNYQDSNVKTDNWLDYFNEIIAVSRGPIVDLGCGLGNDTAYLIAQKKKVIACDGANNALVKVKDNFPEVSQTFCFDMLEPFPLDNNITDLIIADLCLHYFTEIDTLNILKEMKRILINNGNLLVRVNSINDFDNNEGIVDEIEHHLYMTSDGRYKRYFDSKDIYEIFNMFDIKYLRENVMERYGFPKYVYTLRLKNNK